MKRVNQLQAANFLSRPLSELTSRQLISVDPNWSNWKRLKEEIKDFKIQLKELQVKIEENSLSPYPPNTMPKNSPFDK